MLPVSPEIPLSNSSNLLSKFIDSISTNSESVSLVSDSNPNKASNSYVL